MRFIAAITDTHRGGQPPNPRGFSLWEGGKKPAAVLTTAGNVAYATFTVMRSGCAFAEPYPLKHKFMIAEQINL